MNYGVLRSGLVALVVLAGFAPAGADEIKPKLASAKPRPVKAKPQADLVELNSADKARLMTLPGITGAYADKIIAGRPYNSKADLVSHQIIPADLYPGLHALVIVHPKGVKP